MTSSAIIAIIVVLIAAFIAFKMFMASVKMMMRLVAIGVFVLGAVAAYFFLMQ